MSKTKTPFMSLGAHGSIADTITCQKRGTGTIVRDKPVPRQPNTLAQIYQRWDYQDYIAWWHTLPVATKNQWESDARRYHMTGFAYWMKDKLTNLPDLYGRYHLDEATGAVAHDSSRKGKHGAIIGALPVTGVIDLARDFDGINDTILLPLNAFDAIYALGKCTMECFIDHLTMGLTTAMIIDIEGAWFIQIWPVNLGKPSITFTGSSVTEVVGTTAVNDGKRHHIAAVHDGTTQSIYVDGYFQNSNVNPMYNINLVNRTSALGSKHDNTSKWLDTDIDEARIYGRALSPSDILRHSLRRYPL